MALAALWSNKISFLLPGDKCHLDRNWAVHMCSSFQPYSEQDNIGKTKAKQTRPDCWHFVRCVICLSGRGIVLSKVCHSRQWALVKRDVNVGGKLVQWLADQSFKNGMVFYTQHLERYTFVAHIPTCNFKFPMVVEYTMPYLTDQPLIKQLNVSNISTFLKLV